MTVYTHTTPKTTTAGNRSGPKGRLTRAQKKLRTRTRPTENFVTAERIYSEAWPKFGGSYLTTFEDTADAGSEKDLIKKSTKVVGKDSNTFRTHG